MPVPYYGVNPDVRDQQLLLQILADRGQNWGDLLAGASGRVGQPWTPIPLGDLGRVLVKRKQAMEQAAEPAHQAELQRQQPGAPVIPLIHQPNRGMDALLGALRIAEITGGNAETPSFESPPYGTLSQAQLIRAENPAVRLLDRLGVTGGPPQPLPSPRPQTPAAPSQPAVERLQSALAQNAQTIPGPRMGSGRQRRPGQEVSVTRTQLPDLRRRIPWALIQAQLPFPLE